VAADAVALPQVGEVAKAVASLKLSSVPQTQSSRWFVKKVDIVHGHIPFFGIEWELPPDLLIELGSRVSGSLLVSFASVVEHDGAQQKVARQPGLLASARVTSGETQEESLIGDFVTLKLEPKLVQDTSTTGSRSSQLRGSLRRGGCWRLPRRG
jgi:hypothetical protein